MLIEQWIIFGILLLTLVLFITGRVRYDIVALLALLLVTATGLIPVERAFTGFSNPAIVTVAVVLVISRALQNSGVIDAVGERLLRLHGGAMVQLAALTGIMTLLSAFVNNVGALALLLPVAIEVARKKELPPSVFLMPVAFAAHFGGMLTLIGAPTNLMVAAFREQTAAAPFRMFDFMPVGLGVAIAGLLFLVLIGWRLSPSRRSQSSADELFEIEQYVTEVRIPEHSQLNGKRLPALSELVENRLHVLGLVRGTERRLPPPPETVFHSGDILTLHIDAEDLERLVAEADLELVGCKEIERADLESDEVVLIEAVVSPDSLLVGETAFSLDLRKRYRVSLLAISRQGRRLRARLDRIRVHSGDVLLLQCRLGTAKTVLAALGCLPLAERGLRIGQPRRIISSVAIFGLAVVLSALGLVPVPTAFLAVALIMVLGGFVSLREAYASIDWSIIILLGAMIPVGEALQTSGAAQLIADSLLRIAGQMPPAISVTIVLVATMLLSDMVNNAAAVVLMAPIALSVAAGLGTSADPFLMAASVGAACAFLTPIGDQSNTLVMGPGGYRFGDYWRMGILLEVIVTITAVPLILRFWPF